MKRLLGGAAAVVLALGLGSDANATASLELVSGTAAVYSTLYVSDNGLVKCTDVGGSTACGTAVFPPADQNGTTGGISLSGVLFDGYSFTITSGGSNSPNCAGLQGPNCLNDTNINATNVSTGTATVSIYFADTGFNPGAGVTGLKVGFSTPGSTGISATQQAYATTGTPTAPNPLGAGVFNPTTGLSPCGINLSLPGGNVNASAGSVCPAPGTPYSLELATTLTAGVGEGFNVNGTISAIPEPASVALFGSVLVFCASRLRRRKA